MATLLFKFKNIPIRYTYTFVIVSFYMVIIVLSLGRGGRKYALLIILIEMFYIRYSVYYLLCVLYNTVYLSVSHCHLMV